MEAALGQILLGVFTNAISSVLEVGWRSANSEEEVSLEDAIYSAVSRLADVESISDEVGGDQLIRFLRTPEVTALVQGLFVFRVHQEQPVSETLSAAFERAFERELPAADVRHAARLFRALAGGVELIMDKAAAIGEPVAIHAIQSRRFRLIAEELAGLRASLDHLAASPRSDVDAFLEWEHLYRAQVLARHGTLTPPSFDAAERVPVDDIYVKPRFSSPGPAGNGPRIFGGDELAGEIHRTVILGDPGAGKSTYAQKLAFDLAREVAVVPGGHLTPFLIVLKDYGAERARSQLSVVDWIERSLNADYHAEPPASAVDYLLSSGRAVVIFDGLDELLDTSDRRAMTATVETFAARFPMAPVLVTSRRVGYAQAPLDVRRFAIAELEELDDGQVKDYTTLWFGLREELTADASQAMARDFLRDSAEAASDLRRNTLMLALLCNIYRGDGYIPRRRPQVYEKCALMLFERWDRGRRIVVELEFDRHLRPAMQHLAHWIYAAGSLRGGVTESELIRRATEFLHGRRFEDEDSARAEATKFVEFCRGRAWVFTDTGTTSDGERLYQFTHRTFLEYFTAEHLVRTHRTPDDLLAVLAPRIRAGEWDVVAQLAFQLKDDSMDGAGDELIDGLLRQEDGLALSFVARSLAFLVPSRATCANVARAVTRGACDWIVERDGAVSLGRSDSSPAEAFRSLVNCDRENVAPVANAIANEAAAFLDDQNTIQAAVAAIEVACGADLALNYVERLDVSRRWDTAQQDAFSQLWPRLEQFAPGSVEVAYDAFLFGRLPLKEVVDYHGVGLLFEARRFSVYASRIRSDISQLLLDGVLGRVLRPGGEPLGTEAELATFARVLLDAESPWDRSNVLHGGQEHRFDPSNGDPACKELSGDALAGAILTLLVLVERTREASGEGELLNFLPEWPGWVRVALPLIRSRVAGGPARVCPDDSLPSAFREFFRSWAQREWSAVGMKTRRSDAVVELGDLTGGCRPPLPCGWGIATSASSRARDVARVAANWRPRDFSARGYHAGGRPGVPALSCADRCGVADSRRTAVRRQRPRSNALGDGGQAGRCGSVEPGARGCGVPAAACHEPAATTGAGPDGTAPGRS